MMPPTSQYRWLLYSVQESEILRRKWEAYPEDTDGVEWAVRGTIRFDHTEHAVQLPIDEEYDEKVVRIPESLKSSSTDFLSSKEYDDGETSGHDPTCNTGTRGQVYGKES